jgi:hypothetical protein
MSSPENESIEQTQTRLLWEELISAFGDVEGLRSWLRARLPEAQRDLVAGKLPEVLGTLMRTADARDGAASLYQELVDHAPSSRVPGMIYAISKGAIVPRQAADQGQPNVPPYQRWFVFSRPFVDRTHLRSQLQQLATTEGGPESILVIEGERRTGKSMAVSLAVGVEDKSEERIPIDIDVFASSSAGINARDLAVTIADTEEDCPAFDITKEDEAVPHLVRWMTQKLRKSKRWIIIDHCNREFMTRGAQNVLKLLAKQLGIGAMQGVRLILADFSRAEVEKAVGYRVRYDRAVLPTEQQVEEWGRDFATKARKVFDKDDPAKWASSVFKGLERYNKGDGSWHMAFDQRLRRVADTIRACEVQP